MVSARTAFQFIFWVSASIFLTILTINGSDGAKATEHIYFDHITCLFNLSYVTNGSCKLNFMNRTQKSMTVLSLIKKPVNNVLGHTQLYHRFRSGYQIFLIDRIISICDYLVHKRASLILDMTLPTVRKYVTSTQNWTCPYQGRFDIVKLPLNGALLNNMFLPVGHYLVNITAFVNNNELLWNGKYFFEIPEGKTIEDDRMGR